MTISTYDELVSQLTTQPGVSAGKMFGMPTVKFGRKAFAGRIEGDMVFKLSGEQLERALAIEGAHLFDPMGGRPMKEWVVVPAAQAERWEELADAALEYIARLPQ